MHFLNSNFPMCYLLYLVGSKKVSIRSWITQVNYPFVSHLFLIVADRYGYARIGISSPDEHWTFPNDGIINDENPMPCSDEDSKDVVYLKQIFKFIESNPNQFDAKRVYAHGFSQNSVFTSVIGVCFHEKVRGIFLGASGMSIKGIGKYSSHSNCGIDCNKRIDLHIPKNS